MTATLIDLSYPLSKSTPPFPGDPPVAIEWLDTTTASDMQPREHMNCSRISICVHCGTHMDAPFHFFGDGKRIDKIPLEWCVGRAVKIDLRDHLSIGPNAKIDASILHRYGEQLANTERLVVETGWDQFWGSDKYFIDHPVFTRDGARLLVDSGIQLIGVDFPSVDRPPHDAHLEILGSGSVIVENLRNLAQLPTSSFELSTIPLAIVDGDGSPVRAFARVEPDDTAS